MFKPMAYYSSKYLFINIGAFIGTIKIGMTGITTFINGDIQGFRQDFKVCTLICTM